MRRTMWAVLILTVVLLLSAMTSSSPPDSYATLLGEAVGAFVLFYLVIDYAPRKIRAWRATD